MNHCIWIYDRMVHNENPIQVVFIGSSHTFNGINDELLTKKLNNTYVSNFGYCRLGMDLNYVLTKEVIQAKNPKHIFIEVRETEDRYSHPVFPHIARTEDVLFPVLLFNKMIASNFWTHFSYKLEACQHGLYNKNQNVNIDKRDFGFITSSDTIPLERLNKVKIENSVVKAKTSKFEEGFHQSFARSYRKKIHALCSEQGVKLHFIYIPSYGSKEKPEDYNELIKYGDVFIPSETIFNNPSNWYDEGHLNSKGANELTLWVYSQMNNNNF